MYILLNHWNSTYCIEESTLDNYAISLDKKKTYTLHYKANYKFFFICVNYIID